MNEHNENTHPAGGSNLNAQRLFRLEDTFGEHHFVAATGFDDAAAKLHEYQRAQGRWAPGYIDGEVTRVADIGYVIS